MQKVFPTGVMTLYIELFSFITVYRYTIGKFNYKEFTMLRRQVKLMDYSLTQLNNQIMNKKRIRNAVKKGKRKK